MHVRGDGCANRGTDCAFVELVRLNDKHRPPIPRPGAHRVAEVRPPDLSSTHYHFSLAIERACALASSGSTAESSPSSPYTASSFLRTPENLSLLTKADTAFAYSSLRDQPRVFARRSACSNISSGIEIAVFIRVSITVVIPSHNEPGMARTSRWRSRPTFACRRRGLLDRRGQGCFPLWTEKLMLNLTTRMPRRRRPNHRWTGTESNRETACGRLTRPLPAEGI